MGLRDDIPAARAVKVMRQSLGLSMSEFARRWGVSISTVFQVETGVNRNPGYLILQRLVDRFGVDPRLLFNELPDEEVGDD